MTIRTLPNGTRQYVGRRSRLPDSMVNPPPPPAAQPLAAEARNTLRWDVTNLPVAVPLSVSSTAGSGQLTELAGFIVGWSVRETSGSAAFAAELYEGGGSGGQLLAEIGAPSSQVSNGQPSSPGWYCQGGLYLSSVSGAFKGVVWYVPTQIADPAATPAYGDLGYVSQ